MANEEIKAREIARDNCRYYKSSYTGLISADSFEECKTSALKMAEWKDMQAIDEQGWRRDCPRADSIVLIKDEEKEQFYIEYWHIENLEAIQLKLMAHHNIKWRLIKANGDYSFYKF